ncbi:MAG: magnesium chelatase [candidate division GAL15 bacterium]
MGYSFLWPAALWGLGLLPLLAWVYARALHGRSRRALTHSRVPLLAEPARTSRPWRGHLPAGVFGLALAAVILALARPVAPMPVPAAHVNVVLALDVSRSMLAEDVRPNRLEATKTAAVEFVRTLPRNARVGLVSFSSYATLLVPPTADHGRVIEAIRALEAEFATAIGDGLLEAVWALPGRVRPSSPTAPPPPPSERLPPGVVVLMSDGQSNRGISPTEAARVARDQQVKVYTVGVGTPEGTFLNIGGRPIWVRLDEETLREVAAVTDGTYFHASSTHELRRVYRNLGRTIGWDRKPTEVSSVAAASGAVLLVASLAISLLWLHRVS